MEFETDEYSNGEITTQCSRDMATWDVLCTNDERNKLHGFRLVYLYSS